MIYNNPKGVRAAIAAVLQLPIDDVELAYTGDGFRILRPAGAVPDPDEVAAWAPTPEPTPDPDPLEQLRSMLVGREQIAAGKIQGLKAACAVALMAGGMSESDTMAAGSQLVLDHAAKIQAYILAGGNPVAGQALIDEIVETPPAWWSPQMLALFEAELL